MLNERDFSNEAVRLAAFLMAETARTAPKGRGQDLLQIVYVAGEEMEKIIKKMEELAENDRKFFARDANSLRKARGVLILGILGEPLGMNCGLCGMNCDEMRKARIKENRPSCVFRILDLGIALGSAAKLAAILGVDTRLMYSVGETVKKLRMIDADVAIAIPIAVEGKNPFFDRG